MIKNVYRLHEQEVKKVLKYWKPFFSYGIVVNSLPNNLTYSRFAVVIGAKSVPTNISRNFFRRKFYDFVKPFVSKETKTLPRDHVFTVKKQTKLDKKDFESIKLFEKDMKFLINKI